VGERRHVFRRPSFFPHGICTFLCGKHLIVLMRNSTEQGSRRGALDLGARGSAYIIMDITSMRDEDLKKCNKPIPHSQHLSTAKTYLLIQKQIFPTHDLLLQNGLRICELAIRLTKHVELLRVIPIPRQYFRVLEPKLSSYCKKPPHFFLSHS
jgi:hypothetical protein